jgi:glycosyltransferase involved in cell wall biosynthesis
MQVSVIIPVYNAAPFVEKAVASALEQPETGEVILVEDGSPDDSLTVCRYLQQNQPQVVLLRHPDARNHGAAASRNLGIYAARFDIIAFLDADDYYLPGRFAFPLRMLAEISSIDGVYEAVQPVFEESAATARWKRLQSTDLFTMTKRVRPDKLLAALTAGGKGFFSTDGVTVRKSIFDKTGLFDEHLRVTQDTAMWIKMAAVGSLAAGRLQEPVACARAHGRNRMFCVSEDDEIFQYRHRCFETLWEWGKHIGLDRNRQSLLLFQLLNAELARVREESPMKRRLRLAACLMENRSRYPEGFYRPYFWYHLTRRLIEDVLPI